MYRRWKESRHWKRQCWQEAFWAGLSALVSGSVLISALLIFPSNSSKRASNRERASIKICSESFVLEFVLETSGRSRSLSCCVARCRGRASCWEHVELVAAYPRWEQSCGRGWELLVGSNSWPCPMIRPGSRRARATGQPRSGIRRQASVYRR